MSDSFVPAYGQLLPLASYAVRRQTNRSGLLAASAAWALRSQHVLHLDRLLQVRARQRDLQSLPRVVEEALQRWPQLFVAVGAARPAFIHGLGRALPAPPLCDALHAAFIELWQRLGRARAAQPAAARCGTHAQRSATGLNRSEFARACRLPRTVSP